MYKLSKYIICLPLGNDKNQWILINGCSGAFSIISEHLGTTLKNAESDFKYINSLDKTDIELLIETGCLIPIDSDEENAISTLSKKIHADSEKKLDVTFIPSYVCNFNCPYCFERCIKTDNPEWFKGMMSSHLAEAIFSCLDKEIENGKKISSFTLFGGEPFLPQNKDIIELILDKCKSYNAPIFAVTNGYYLDQYIEILKKHSITTLKITIDGTKEVHDKRRSPKDKKSFDRIIENVLLALKNNIAVSLRTNINRENFECISKLKDFYDASPLIKFKNFSYYFKATMACFEPAGNAVSDIDIINVIGNKCENYCQNSAFNRIYLSIDKMLKNNKAPFKADYCGAHCGNLVFDPYGKIYSCWDILTDERSVIGKVDIEKNLLVFNDNYKTWNARTVDTIARCKDCKYKLFCGGGCAAQGLVANDNMNMPFCENFVERFNMIATKTVNKLIDKGC